MKILKSVLLISILSINVYMSAQDMTEGFTYLETGKYEQAEQFFSTVLESFPENKTARLCYGRAVGLNGKPGEAQDLFTALVEDYPNDFEVKLNYGESLLWNKNFTDAKTYFEALIEEDPNSFPAVLSYANTLSNLKQYPEAITYVNKALDILPGNANAMTSKKYMYLGYAYQNQQSGDYEKAEELLLQNLEWFEDDKDTLQNLGNLYLIWEKLDKGEATYQRLSEQPGQQLTGLNGLALVAHLKGKDKKALALSKQAYESLSPDEDKAIAKATTERYVQALIWNKKYKAAETLISELNQTYPNTNWVLALRATLSIYRSDFKESLADYNRILENDSTSFDGNLGKANVLKALGKEKDAVSSAVQTLAFYNNQKDALNFLKQIKLTHRPFVETKFAYSFDNGDNVAINTNTKVSYPVNKKLNALGEYTYRTTENTVTTNQASSHHISLGVNYNIAPNIDFNGLLGVNTTNAETDNFSQVTTDLSVTVKALKLQYLNVGYSRTVESFNADLLDRELIQNNFYANYNLGTNFNLGWYTQYIYTTQNDDNQRHLLFTSLYYNILSKPILKGGINYQYISFKDQVPTIYFSPERFNAVEVFVNLVKDENTAKPKSWFYNATFALGQQYIEDDSSQGTYRLQANGGYKFTDRFLVSLFGIHSNIASATAAGFEYSEIGVRLKWVF